MLSLLRAQFQSPVGKLRSTSCAAKKIYNSGRLTCKYGSGELGPILFRPTFPNSFSQQKSMLLCSCSDVSDFFASPWTVARQSPLPMGFSGKNTGVGCHFFSRGSSSPTDRTLVSSLADDSLPLSQLGSPPRLHNQALI